ADVEGSFIKFDFVNFSIASLYFPSGYSVVVRQEYKMHFLKKYKEILKEQVESGSDFIVCGDVNIVHIEIDIKNWKANYGKTSGVLP
ncbi:exodeoxyribonuclease III, partial [Francisella tularensis subsp. holarctica]|nr:exodeoxyribonuclease III [Francisella tularensis subsp. holarctica]